MAPHRNTDPLTSWVLPCASRRSCGGAARNMEACGTHDPEHGEVGAGSRGEGAQRSARREIFSGTLCCTQTHAHYLSQSVNSVTTRDSHSRDRSCSRPFYIFSQKDVDFYKSEKKGEGESRWLLESHPPIGWNRTLLFFEGGGDDKKIKISVPE